MLESKLKSELRLYDSDILHKWKKNAMFISAALVKWKKCLLVICNSHIFATESTV